MCIHRFSNCNGCNFSVEVVVSYSRDKGNGVYKLCKHCSSNCTSCKFSVEAVVIYSGDERNGVY